MNLHLSDETRSAEALVSATALALIGTGARTARAVFQFEDGEPMSAQIDRVEQVRQIHTVLLLEMAERGDIQAVSLFSGAPWPKPKLADLARFGIRFPGQVRFCEELGINLLQPIERSQDEIDGSILARFMALGGNVGRDGSLTGRRGALAELVAGMKGHTRQGLTKALKRAADRRSSSESAMGSLAQVLSKGVAKR